MAAAFHPDNIDAPQGGAKTCRYSEGDDIGRHAAHAADHRTFADPHVLVHGDQPAEKGIVAHGDVSAKDDVVGEGDVVADLAIMPNVAAHHDKAAVPDRRRTAAVFGAHIDGHVLANVAFGSD